MITAQTEIDINKSLVGFCRKFQVGPLSTSFRLEVNGYSGTAGLFGKVNTEDMFVTSK